MNNSNEPAQMRYRIFAGAVDLALAIGLPLVIQGLVGGGAGVFLAVVGLVAVLGLQMSALAQTGCTLGKWAVGIRLVDVHTGAPVGVDRVLLRGLLVALGGLAAGIGALVILASPAFDLSGRRRGLHDKTVDAEVVHVGAGIASAPQASAPAPAEVSVQRPGQRPGPAQRPGASVRPGPSVRPAPSPGPRPAPPSGRRSVTPRSPAGGPVPASPPTVPVKAAPARGPATHRHDDDAPMLAYGLMPELERTRRTGNRPDVAWDDEETYRPMTAEIELSDGSAHDVQGVVLIGRNPITGPGQTGLRLVDRERSVSRTHLRLTVGPIAVWVEDLGTVNGTILHLPDGTDEICESGRPVQLPIGSVVSVGDAWLRLGGVSGEPTFPERTAKR